jgi:hypothetical protein
MGKKKVANKLEQAHLSKVASLGCLICQQPAICHHIRNRGDGKGNLGFGNRANHYEVFHYALTTMLVALVFITPKDNLNLCMELRQNYYTEH